MSTGHPQSNCSTLPPYLSPNKITLITGPGTSKGPNSQKPT